MRRSPTSFRRARSLTAVVVLALVGAVVVAVPQFHGTASALTGAGGFVPLSPARILSTRDAVGDVRTALLPNGFYDQQITGRGGVPSTGVSAVVLNVTVIAGARTGYLTVYPSGESFPPTSNVNFEPNQTVPNLVQVKVGANGRVSIFNSDGVNHVIFDVSGYYTTAGQPAADGYVPFNRPVRLFDSRNDPTFDPNGVNQGISPLSAGETVSIDVDEDNDFDAIAVNITAVRASEPTFVTLFPFNATRTPPLASNLNVLPGQTIANAAIVRLASDGRFLVFNSRGNVDVIIDAVGAFTRPNVNDIAQHRFVVVPPTRILSTRDGIGASGLIGQTPFTFRMTGRGGVPASASVGAVAMNLTATQPSRDGYMSLYAGAATLPPETSSLNFRAGQSVPNHAVAAVNNDGTVNLYNAFGLAHAIYDVFGYYEAVDITRSAGATRMIDGLRSIRIERP